VLALAVALGAQMYLDSGRSSTIDTFLGDFEVGPPGWQQFDGLEYEEDRRLADTFELVTAPVRQGWRAVRMTIRQGYSRFGHNEATLLVRRGGERDGDEYWYAWSTFFPPEWKTPLGWGVFAEWHANLATSPIIGFDARGDHAKLGLLSGAMDDSQNRAAVDRVVPLLPTLSKGRWNDFVVHVRWRVAAAGFVEVYHRLAGETSLRKLVSWKNVPTFQVTGDGRGLGTYFLLGIYRRSSCPQPTQLGCMSSLGEQPPSVVYHDAFARATTFEAAAAAAFPGPTPALPNPATPAVQVEGSRLVPLNILRLSRRARSETDRACRICRAASPESGRIEATIAGAADDRDTAVLIYRPRQRSRIVVSYRLRVDASRLSGPLVVAQLRGQDARLLAELYVDRRGLVRLASPAGALHRRGFNLETGIAAGPGKDERTMELRLSSGNLQVGVDGRLVRHFRNLKGPRRGAHVHVRLGIERYEGRAGDGPIRATLDEVIVGES
jgi:hypothetical protein